ncbi:MAG: FAD-binding protein [Caldilineaceae bacterium]|nr:FAD-binding protein [Caldilineaceae bacterium]
MNATTANPVNTIKHTTHTPATAGEVQELVATLPKLLPHGAQTKPPLLNTRAEQEVARLDMTRLTGIIEYDPGEYTFTAYAGTPLTEITAALAEYGQTMPFDPPLVQRGATLGGTIAAGISGSGRYRYGGLRDFILGVHFVDGQGRLVRGGGKVVKNAAGFDLPKLMVGSMGRLGVLISASFKVFPAPLATATLHAPLPSLEQAVAAMTKLMGGPYDLEALDLLPQDTGTSVTLLARIGGPTDVLSARMERLRTLVGSGDAVMDDQPLWDEAREFTWTQKDVLLVKVPTTPHTLTALDHALRAANAQRRYAVGGNVAWVAWPQPWAACDQLLTSLGSSGLILRGDSPRALIGAAGQSTFLSRIRTALDPSHRFLDYE